MTGTAPQRRFDSRRVYVALVFIPLFYALVRYAPPLGLFGLVEMVIFVLTVFVAYAYVWRRGGLEWD